MSTLLTFRNSRGRTFRVGDHVIAYDEPFPEKCYPCLVGSTPQTTDGRAAPPLVGVNLFLPHSKQGLAVHVSPVNLFPSFAAIADRQRFPAWFAGRLFPSIVGADTRQTSPAFEAFANVSNFEEAATVIEVAEAFAVRHLLHDERYLTLDRWLGSVDRFVDANPLRPHERRDVDALRLYIQHERAQKLRRENIVGGGADL